MLDFEWREQKTVTLADLRDALGASEEYARYVAHRLVRKGWLERLRPGLFQFIPADRGREPIADTNPLLAGAALLRPYFFSFGTACTHHGLTEQVFAEVYIASRQRRRHRPDGDPRARLIGRSGSTALRGWPSGGLDDGRESRRLSWQDTPWQHLPSAVTAASRARR